MSNCLECGAAHTYGGASEPWGRERMWCPRCRAYTKQANRVRLNAAPGAQFDGATLDPAQDTPRLKGQLARVFDAMKDGYWVSLEDIARLANAPGASVSARLRDLRKEKFGGYTVHRKNKGGGLWLYRLEVPGPRQPEQGSLL